MRGTRKRGEYVINNGWRASVKLRESRVFRFSRASPHRWESANFHTEHSSALLCSVWKFALSHLCGEARENLNTLDSRNLTEARQPLLITYSPLFLVPRMHDPPLSGNAYRFLEGVALLFLPLPDLAHDVVPPTHLSQGIRRSWVVISKEIILWSF